MQDLLAWLDQYPALFALFIILARIIDVSIGTLRTIMVVKGYRFIAAGLGVIEVVVWVSAVSGVLLQITLVKVTAYAIGFGLGNIVGVALEQKLALGHQVVTLLSNRRTHDVAFGLRMAGYHVTQVAARGDTGRAAMCLVVVPRRQTRHVIDLARRADHDVFTTVQDVRVTPVAASAAAIATGWRGVFKRK